jgi:hypothetical protein
MKRLTLLLTGALMVGVVALAAAGDFHVGTSLVCSDCHVAHYSQSHGYTVGGIFTPLGAEGPYEDLLRDDPNKVCLACHNGASFAPDVFGANGGTTGVRQAGGLNAATGHGLSNDAGYDQIDGHTLYSTAMPPGAGTTAYVPGAEGLTCVNCHAQHGIAAQYRNLLNRGNFAGDTLSYAVGTNDLTRDVFERGAAEYTIDRVDFNEPSPRQSHYGKWCQTCHKDFHGQGGDANMGGLAGGVTSTNATPWKRHPTADVNIGESGTAATFISSLARYAGVTNKVKVMDSQGLWTGTGSDNTVTPSCMSCHKAHGNMNGFGLIFMIGTGTVTEEGDGGVYKDLCRQCHSQGA